MRRSPSALLIVVLALAGLALAAGVQPAHALCPDGSFQCTCNGAVSCQTSILGCWSSCESASKPEPDAASRSTTASFVASLAPTAEELVGSTQLGPGPGPGACSPEFCDSCALVGKACQKIVNICACVS